MIEITLQFPNYYALTNEEKAIIDSVIFKKPGEDVPQFELLGVTYICKSFAKINDHERPGLMFELVATRVCAAG